jgi:hypothetical protein
MYKEDLELKHYFFSELESIKDNWNCYANEPERQVYTKYEEGNSIVSVFYRFKCPTNMFFPLSLLSEVDLFKDWMPSIIRSDIVKNLSDFRKVLHV